MFLNNQFCALLTAKVISTFGIDAAEARPLRARSRPLLHEGGLSIGRDEGHAAVRHSGRAIDPAARLSAPEFR